MTQWLTQEIDKVKGVVLAGAFLLAIVFVLTVWWRTKNVVQTLVAMVTAGAVLFAVNNPQWFQNKVAEETKSIGVLLPAAAVYRRRHGSGMTVSLTGELVGGAGPARTHVVLSDSTTKA